MLRHARTIRKPEVLHAQVKTIVPKTPVHVLLSTVFFQSGLGRCKGSTLCFIFAQFVEGPEEEWINYTVFVAMKLNQFGVGTPHFQRLLEGPSAFLGLLLHIGAEAILHCLLHEVWVRLGANLLWWMKVVLWATVTFMTLRNILGCSELLQMPLFDLKLLPENIKLIQHAAACLISTSSSLSFHTIHLQRVLPISHRSKYIVGVMCHRACHDNIILTIVKTNLQIK